jgi:hypothetical protein
MKILFLGQKKEKLIIMDDEKKRIVYKYSLILLCSLVSALFVIIFFLFWPALSGAFLLVKDIWLVVLIGVFRIVSYFIMCLIVFRKWFKQEKIYLSDAYFLFGIFFLIYTYAKIFDLFWYFAYSSENFNEDFLLYILKMRFFVIILNALPLIFLGLEVILSFIEVYNHKTWSARQKFRYKYYIIVSYFGLVSLLIILAPDRSTLYILLPVIVLGTAIGLVIMFLFMYRNRHLSHVNGLIIGIGFIGVIITSFIRVIIPLEVLFILLIELLDFAVYTIIFIGFMTKPKYIKH